MRVLILILILCMAGCAAPPANHFNSDESDQTAVSDSSDWTMSNSYSLEDRKKQAQFIANDSSLQVSEPYEIYGGIITVYWQPVEEYGESNRETWVIFEQSGKRKVLLQNGGRSTIVDTMAKDDSIYIAGKSYAFATLTGVNIMKYTIAEDKLIIQSVIDESSFGDRFQVYKDESNETLRSIIPHVESGFGRVFFGQFENESSFTATVDNESDGYKLLKLTLNNKGLFSFTDEE